jgi:hypothetical protein
MSNDLTDKPAAQLDGFAGFEDGVEGDEEQFSERIIIGERLKFTNEAKWLDTNEADLSERELVAVDVKRVVQKWSRENQPIDRIILAPGQKFPDIKKMNEETPQSEWREGPDGKLHGPWQSQHVLYLGDVDKVERFCFPTATTGGHRAVCDLVDKIKWMRRWRGAAVYPVVKLSKTFMPTRFGGRMRPDLPVQRWVAFGGGGESLPAAETPKLETISTSAPAEASAKTTLDKVAQSGVREVKEPSLSEEMGDKVPW